MKKHLDKALLDVEKTPRTADPKQRIRLLLQHHQHLKKQNGINLFKDLKIGIREENNKHYMSLNYVHLNQLLLKLHQNHQHLSHQQKEMNF